MDGARLMMVVLLLVAGCSRDDSGQAPANDPSVKAYAPLVAASPTAEVGEGCEDASECKTALCVRHKPTPRGASVCTTKCRSARDCPTGGEWTCANTARGATDGYCIPAGTWVPRKATLPAALPSLAVTSAFDAGPGSLQ